MSGRIADPEKLLKLKTMQKQLTRLYAHFPMNRTVESLAIIAPDYFEAFKGFYDSEFIELVDMAIVESRFFPSIRDLKETWRNMSSYRPVQTVDDFDVELSGSRKISEENKRKLDEILNGSYRDINE